MASTINADNGVASGITGIRTTADNSGNLALQANGVTVLTVNTSNAAVFSGAVSVSGNAAISGNTSFTGSINAPNTFGFKNRLINGSFNIWQRGTSFSTSGGTYTADRWWDGYQLYTLTQSTDVPANTSATYSINVNSTSASYAVISQRIESYNCKDLVGQTVTVSFWCKNISGSSVGLQVNLQYANAQDNFTATTTIQQINLANPTASWAFYSATFTNLPSGVANGLVVTFGGSSSIIQQSRYALAQCELGSQATSFDVRPYGTELALCQRYLPVIQPVAGSTTYVGYGAGEGTTSAAIKWRFPVTTRVPPTGVTATTAAGFGADDNVGTTTATNITFTRATTDECLFRVTVASGLTQYRYYQLSANATSQIQFTGCEL